MRIKSRRVADGTHKIYFRSRNIIAALLIIIVIGILFFIFPLCYSLKPDLTACETSELERDIVLNGNSFITLYGDDIDELDSLYINGDSVPYSLVPDTEAETVEEDSENQMTANMEHINIQFDMTPYREENSIALQIGKNEGGFIRLKSDKLKLEIVDSELEKPEIISLNCDEVLCPQKEFTLRVYGTGINENSQIAIGNEEVNEIYVSEKLDYCETVLKEAFLEDCGNSLEIRIVQYTDGGRKTSIVSETVSLPVTHIDFGSFEHQYDWVSEETQIMHALGDFEGKTYTNSKEALDESISGDANIFEFAISFDKDGVLIGRHDWSRALMESNDAELEDEEITGLPLSYLELKEALKNQYTVLSFEEIVQILADNPDYYIVTDTKYENAAAVENTFEEIVNVCKKYDEGILDRIVVQVYSEEMYRSVMKVYPFKSVIYTLYMSENSEEEVLNFIGNTNVRAIAFPAESRWDSDEFLQSILEMGCYAFVHTVNDYAVEKEYLARGVTGVYTDVLTPGRISEYKQTEEINLLEAAGITGETDVHSYFSLLKDSDYTIIIAAADDASSIDEISEDMINLGLEAKVAGAFRQGYIAIIDKHETVYEEVSQDILKYSYQTTSGQLIEVESAGNDSGSNASIKINGQECAANMRGLNIVVLDAGNNRVIDSAVYDNYNLSAAELTRYETVENISLPVDSMEYAANRKKILRYFNDLCNENFVIMMVVQDEATTLVDDEMMEAMSRIGVSKNYKNAFRNSYLAIFDGGNQIVQNFAEGQPLEYKYEVDGNKFVLLSGGNGSGVQAGILWNGEEMAAVERGLHILVYDKLLGTVVSYCRMDLFGSLECDITEVNEEIYK